MNTLHRENDLWQYILSIQDPNERRARVLELIHHLLNQTRLKKRAIAHLDEDDLDDLFIEYQQIGQQVEHFLHDSLPHIDPAEQGLSFEQQLQTLNTSLSDTRKRVKQYTQQRQTLLTQQEKLQTEQHDLQQAKTAWQAIDKAVKQLEANNAKLKKELRILQKKNSNDVVNDHMTKAEQIQQQQLETLLQTIPEMVATLKDNLTLYQQHFAANEQITTAIQAEAITFTDELMQHMKQLNGLSQNTQQHLSQWDQALKMLIKKQQQMQKNIERLQKSAN